MRYIIPAIRDLVAARKGKPVAPFDAYEQGRKALGLVGLEGVSLIAVSGIDMAAWDALAKSAGQPLAVSAVINLPKCSVWNNQNWQDQRNEGAVVPFTVLRGFIS